MNDLVARVAEIIVLVVGDVVVDSLASLQGEVLESGMLAMKACEMSVSHVLADTKWLIESIATDIKRETICAC